MLGLGLTLLIRSLDPKPFTEELLIYDLIWLDGWALLFYFALAIVWVSNLTRRSKARLIVALLAVHGVVAVALMFDGTPFSFNAYWGDQKFRQAMILKLASFGWLTDFYFKDLPPFYPPLYYSLLALYSRVFSLEAFKMLKIGSLYIYLFGPFLLYWLWRKIVTPTQAALITVFSFLFCSMGKGSPLIAPHAFIANSIFIPWWLYYIERVKDSPSSWRYYIGGSIIGAAIFMTYFYPFFIGGFLILLRLTILRGWKYYYRDSSFSLKRTWHVLFGSALLSAPYWLPLFYEMFRLGSKPARQGWHHIGSTGIAFPFIGWSIPAILFLVGLVYALRRPSTPLNRGLLTLVGTTVFFYLCGALLGAVDRPVNLIKANEFMLFFGGPVIGLAAAGFVRREQINRRRVHVAAIVVSIILLFFLHNMNSFAKHEMVRTARTAHVAYWVERNEFIDDYPGSVFLTGNEELYAFYPVYAFLGVNQHYCHPASQFEKRFDFLNRLRAADHPALFNLALRHNRFDPVDFIMPRVAFKRLELTFALSNYPNRYRHATLVYDENLVTDTAYFERMSDFPVYRLRELTEPPPPITIASDSLQSLTAARLLRKDLDQAGQDLLDRLYGTDWKGWQDIPIEQSFTFGDEIKLLGGSMISTADSIQLIAAFQATSGSRRRYKIYFHTVTGDGEDGFQNYDFLPPVQTNRWKKGEIIFCSRTIPDPGVDFRYFLGFFQGETRLGGPFRGEYSATGQ